MTGLQALFAAAVAGLLTVVGVAILAGPGWAFIGAGVWLAVTTVLLYEPNPLGRSSQPEVGMRR